MDNKRRRALEAIKMVATLEGTSVNTVYQEIEHAISRGLFNPDPEVQQMWRMLSCSGKIPTPEDVILYIVENLSDNHLN